MVCDEASLKTLRRIARNLLKTMRYRHEILPILEDLTRGLSVEVSCAEEALAREEEDLKRVHAIEGTRVVDPPDGHLWYSGPEDLDWPSERWNYFKSKMIESGRSEEQIRSVDRDSTAILARVPSPVLEGVTSGKGLALGYVQSGKTTNFMALAAKAADAGYRFIIVLSGVTNSLRAQTQSEMEKYVAPFENELDWFWLTNTDRDFIFSHTPAVTQVFNPAKNVAVCVVKKNATKLRALIRWYGNLSPADRAEIPLLVIDDECDQASINGFAARAAANSNISSAPDEVEIRRTAINKLIVQLLGDEISPHSAYVGYSATPFSNLLLDPNDKDDLYPRDFIYSLEKGNGYFGPDEIFGRDPVDEEDQTSESMDVFNEIDPENIPKLGSGHLASSNHEPEIIPELRQAILWFLIASGIREQREERALWTTMLIHTSQRISCHNAMANAVSKFITELRLADRDDLNNEVLSVFRTELAKLESSEFAGPIPSEKTVIDSAIACLHNLNVIVDNSQSADRLNYDEVDGNAPHPVIVIGGNTLSRGLVLHGLTSTFFLRTARGYDALLQMGRWFGYRTGWADLPRIWMTKEMQESFRFLALVEEEIRQQIAMYSADKNPEEVGVRIRCHPKLQVTSRGLGRVQRHIGLSGLRVETILFPRTNSELLRSNTAAGKDFVNQIVDDGRTQVSRESSLVRDVPVSMILDLLDNYEFADDARVAERNVLKKYIEKIVGLSSDEEFGELQIWDVFLYRLRGANPRLEDFAGGMSISKITRSARQSREQNHIADLHHLASQIDVATNIPQEALSEFLTENDRAKSDIKYQEWPILKRDVFGLGGRGLLGLYLVDKNSESRSKNKKNLESDEDLLGLTFFFPLSRYTSGGINYVQPPAFVGNIDPEDMEAIVDEDPVAVLGEIESEDEVPDEDDPQP